MRLENKVVFLGGAGAGMGRACARLFAKEGARVAVAARSLATIEDTAEMILRAGGQALPLAGDLTDRLAVERMVDQVTATWGRLDVLYYGAGGFFNPAMGLDEMENHDEPFFALALKNTLLGLYHLVQACRPHLAGGGAIVTVAASESVRQAGNPAYAAAKSGLIGMSRNLARNLHRQAIRVNCIGSGLIRAPQAEGTLLPVPGLARTGHPEDIAYAALYLASDESAWVTGQLLNVDGGVDAGGRALWDHER
jgi:NAD(P)-dependent dehydrogenase (short-subunit alcohol dehydrogenase family)